MSKVKIYKIVNDEDNNIYIGSTIQPLYKRFNEHKKRWRRKDLTQYSSSLLFNKYGYEKCKIILIEEFYIINIEERKKKEQEFIDKFKNICVNKYKVITTPDYLKEKQKEYYENKKKKIEENQESYKAKRNEKINCDICNKCICKGSFKRHIKLIHTNNI